jgi:hypothetical protein
MALIPGLPDRGAAPHGVGCDCCSGIRADLACTPGNRAGLAALDYRPGRFAELRDLQLALLSSASLPALARLRSREADDFSIALIDAWSAALEVLGFYDERFANEAFLGTAQERRSLAELGALIGYTPGPGVAAAADLAFTLDSPAGAPPPVAVLTLPAGSRVQSVPGPGEQAQTFETVAALEARVAWNAILPRRSRLVQPANGATGTWVAGVATGLRVGDPILIVGRERIELDPGSERWDVRRLTAVTPNAEAGRTWIAWTPGLGSIDPPGLPAQEGHRIFAFRGRAGLFGWNAPHPRLLPRATRVQYGFPDSDGVVGDWSFDIDTANRRIVLDGVQEGWVPGSFVALTRPSDLVELYIVQAAIEDGRSAYAISAKATRLTLDSGEHLSWFESSYRAVAALGRSEELAFAETPLLEPLMGDRIELAGQAAGLPPGRRLIVYGPRAAAVVVADGLALAIDGAPAEALPRGTVVTLLGPPVPMVMGSAIHLWALRAPGGAEGTLTAALGALRHLAAPAGAETIAEVATLAAVERVDATHDRLVLEEALGAAFDRAATVIRGNVAPATHGETTEEILGDGDSARAFAAYTLKQAPLTFVSAETATGAEPAIELRVNDVLWKPVPTLYGAGPRDRVFMLRPEEKGGATAVFGDGAAGARPPTGRNNIVARYRKGLGLAGSVGAGALTTAIDRPLGLKEVTNPIAAIGGADAETIEESRRNAPVTVLTLGRVVSLANYEDFARGFAGIAHARADWLWDGSARRILVTVAGPGGDPVPPGSRLHANLLGQLRALGDPFVRVDLAPHRPVGFRASLRIGIDPAHLPDNVLAAVETALRDAFSFERRGFAPLVAASAVIAVAAAVEGVVAVDLERLHRTTPPSAAPILHQRLLARGAGLVGGQLAGAEILTLDPAPLAPEAMP